MNTEPCIIRAASLNDAHAIAYIHHVSRQRGYENLMDQGLLNTTPMRARQADWVRQLEQMEGLGKQILVAEVEGRVVGFSVIGPEGDDVSRRVTAELDRIYVDPNCWAQGVGRLLFQACLDWTRKHGYKQVCVWTFESNERSRRFYESRGFVLQADKRTIGIYPREVRYLLTIGDRLD